MLGKLASALTSLRGRKYPELPHPYRTDFQRDRDRIVHCRAFRRLENKTQVFAAGLCDHFRNRLTHTLEVSQIARTVATVLKLNEELTEALALAHDVGHPPFAHAGEEELHRQMQAFGDRFEHNLHSLRLVDHLELRYARFPGLNLTFEVREGIVKHSREVQPGDDLLLQEFLPGVRPPLEAQLIDLADEIAYNTADLDDGFGAGLFSLEKIAEAIPAYAELLEQAQTQFPGSPDRVQFQEILRQLVNTLVSGLIQGTHDAAAKAGVETVEDVRALDHRVASLTPPAKDLNRQLKSFLFTRVYDTEPLLAERKAATEKIAGLFQFLLANPDHIAGYREQLEIMPLHRVVCDYIAGMTDGYFLRTYAGFFDTGK